MTRDAHATTSEMVKCRECGVPVRWTGIYGDWCATCKPRTLPVRRVLWAVLPLVLLVATPAAAQLSTVYTNVVNGRRVAGVVRVLRVVGPAAPVPPSIVTTEVLPRNYRPPLGATSYVPPVPSSMAATLPRPAPVAQPWFINGVYVGPSPTGNWMSTTVGRPVIDVNIVGRPRRPR